MHQGIFRRYSSRESGEPVSESRSAGADSVGRANSVGAGSVGAGCVAADSAAKRAASPTAVLSVSPAARKRSESCIGPTVVTPSEPGGWMA